MPVRENTGPMCTHKNCASSIAGQELIDRTPVRSMQTGDGPTHEGVKVRAENSPIQIGEIGDLCVSLTRFLICSSALPMRDSCSLANFAFRRRCSSVWACEGQVQRSIHKPRGHAFGGNRRDEKVMRKAYHFGCGCWRLGS